jgi:peroxiredoxin
MKSTCRTARAGKAVNKNSLHGCPLRENHHYRAAMPGFRARHDFIPKTALEYAALLQSDHARSRRRSSDSEGPMSQVTNKKGPLRYVAMALVAAVIAGTGYVAFGGQQKVPDATFTLLSGQKISTAADLKGKVYLINFWATSCETCMKEMPQMVDTYNKFKGRGLEFVAVAMNYDAPMYVNNYAQSRNLPFKVAMDDGSAAKQFGNVQLTPTTFVVDKDGKILKRYVGEPTFAELDQLLEKALDSKA